MHHNLSFDLDKTLLDFHASERLGVKFVMEQKGLEFTEELYQSFKQINKSLWLEFEKGSIIVRRTAWRDKNVGRQ